METWTGAPQLIKYLERHLIFLNTYTLVSMTGLFIITNMDLGKYV